MDQPTFSAPVSIHPLEEGELDDADRIFRRAFGTFLGLPDSMAFMSGSQLVHARWRADPTGFLAAHLDGALVGSNYATNWGSVGFLGPLTIEPGLWDRGIGRHLLEATMELFAGWGTRHVGLFTFPHSPKHIALYQKFGFWPGTLTAVMRKQVRPLLDGGPTLLLSALPEDRRSECLDACFELSDAVHAGLDLRGEIGAVLAQGTGDTLLLWEGSRLDAFAICHCGAGSEAEGGTCYVKFGLCRSGPRSDVIFQRLLDACERFAAARSVDSLIAGVNTARHGAYRAMLGSGFEVQILGVTMHRPHERGYDQEETFLIDDWR